MTEPLLQITDLRTSFFTDAGEVKAVRGVSFSLDKGKTLGLVGESGCGKSVTALSIMRLVSFPGRVIKGEVLYRVKESESQRVREKDLLKISEDEMRKIRGAEIAMVFQEPMTSLNPVLTIGNQISEAISLHQNLNKREVIDKAIEMLKLVGIPSPEKRIKDYPHQMSGGMRQRAMIAMALSCNPSILIADEPTTALDVTIQAQILELIQGLQKKLDMAMILITHDLGVVAEAVDNVAVMYAGKIVEYADTKTLFEEPMHPYTVGLLNSLPTMEKDGGALKTIPGTVPGLLNLPAGCTFYDRCPKADSGCTEHEPELVEIKKEHLVACYKA
ncbi:MAG: peptide ABC transporter ATP-binding protein [Deltaproteobacteria bacterium RIFCSPLOWO2_12_FULL_43_16]|nr:MAG: peptide ABC transporter ATP-binding protein [Deltaproteobacteria bacterium GWA2_43_19]OGQ09401.1 MAG: peptide ABC transporter ATP-binding protein [Deltaproteobacteria bacterium RIFCSPHIGHO2_02_FULL_43_33]OGQ48226.1 MAG: peptide ABC transporter ATP-binding protein [Deltaproteobacteria bacterium RIFCSPLOWO2_02_44_9]OGQ58631.1 MAG: peptide ABC transporter ATP-binding protein [Deltaproteobacteria bacterium RIFCSPLOWO2_12_FULL_43_16]